MRRTSNSIGRIGLTLLAVSATCILASPASAQIYPVTATPGAGCQPRNGNEQQYLRHGMGGVGNNLGGPENPAVDVVCSLVRIGVDDTHGPAVRVWVWREPSTVAPISCTLDIRTPWGLVSASKTGTFAGEGNGYIDLVQEKVNPGDYYNVVCTLPYRAAVRVIYMQ